MTELINTNEVYKESREKLHETMDCVVRAIASAYDTTYDKAHYYCRKYLNRPHRKGVQFPSEFDGKDRISRNTDVTIFNINYRRWCSRKDFEDLCTHEDVGRSGMYVSKFIKNYPKGIYIVLSNRHAFTIKDGVVYGNSNDHRKYIQVAYKLVKKSD